MTADQILALDVGTQSVRAALVGPRGELHGVGRVAIEPYVSPQPGWAEQDPQVWWSALGEACARLWAEDGARRLRDGVGGVGLTTQRGTIVAADEHGTPLRPAIVWLDQRRTRDLPAIGGLYGVAFRIAGARRIVAALQAEAEANWIRAHEPSVWARIRRYGLLSAWLSERLTGRWVDSAAAQVGYLPFDYRRFRWAAPRDWKWTAAPADPAWLPHLVPPTAPLGELTAEAAALLGVPAGITLYAAAADKASEVVGSGAIEPHQASLSLGTSAVVNVTSARYAEAVRLIPPFPSAVPGRYSVEVQVQRGFWLVEWFRREFGMREIDEAATLDVPVESLFDRLVADTPPGSMGLVLQPTWTPGPRIPGPESKGAVIGWGEVHTRAHLYRAILEGIAYGLREGSERIAKATGVPLRELRVSGGGARSPAAVQLAADVFGLPVLRPHTHETSALGAAIDAAVGMGLHADVPAAVAEMVRVVETRDPDPAVVPLYDDLYRTVYRRLYGRLRPIYREIQRITNYP